MRTPSLTLFIEDYKRASLAGALPEPDTLLRQLDELCEEAHPGECSKPPYIADYQRARLAGLPVDLGLQVAQLYEDEDENEDDEDDYCPDCGSEFCYGDCDDEDEDDEDEF